MQSNAPTISISQARQDAASIFLAKVFNWMAVGLGITGVVAYLTAFTGLAVAIANSPLFLVLAIGTLGLVFFLSARIDKIQASTASLLFVGYAVLNGLFFSTLFLRYTGSSIAGTFLITAGMFGAMALYGLVTKRDLSGWGSFLFMGLIGILIAMVVNIFLQSPAVYWVTSMIGVLIFTGLTAYDVQKIKRMGEEGIMTQGQEAIVKGSIMGALALYLDFINLFLMLLRFFGGSRD
ncbi:Bax inhibitor-1/YccA family protein [Desulfofustis limnaeus]|jgi:FtsH-binding integral membrane protein|uniref:Membrane protein n=1 Tax=Desulfofustis limnaeus TaxID=2740163 RepID=A0ABM7W854_9BACT|nr:Bax inhibitor-1/YccA family protein [Desulfofustis limnaeus]MDX9894750.1 Bax inhibitor-1/YccA family protein [Desulfofustis sp.]BDD87090.1 membrane protein [Desulfofustis limnaeus]